MSDIVDRLENMWMEQEPKLLWTDMESITEEAAEEITRLRKENEQLRDAYDTEALLISYNLGYACGKDITKDIVKDEIERRHAEFTKVDMELVADLSAERNRLRDENEKLRFERDTIGEANYVNGWNDAINSSEAMQDLRKALLYVYDNSLGLDPDKITDDIEWVTKEIRTARKALETKK